MIAATGAAVAGGLAGWLAARGSPVSRLPRPPSATGVAVRSERRLRSPEAIVVASLAGAAVTAVLAGPLVAVGTLALALAVAAELRDGAVRRERARTAASWRVALGAVAGALSAGLTVPDALQRGSRTVAGSAPGTDLAAAAAAIRLGSSPAQALAPRVPSGMAGAIRLGGNPAQALASRVPSGVAANLLAGLRVTADSGLAPSRLLTSLAHAVADEERAARAATGAVASARATTRLLAALPLAGIGLAAAFGASAPAFLLSGPTGHLCLAVAALLEAAGLRWSALLLRGRR